MQSILKCHTQAPITRSYVHLDSKGKPRHTLYRIDREQFIFTPGMISLSVSGENVEIFARVLSPVNLCPQRRDIFLNFQYLFVIHNYFYLSLFVWIFLRYQLCHINMHEQKCCKKNIKTYFIKKKTTRLEFKLSCQTQISGQFNESVPAIIVFYYLYVIC